jgi:tRNA threonylcarbamoyladenosine biosynthesis protein TsaE
MICIDRTTCSAEETIQLGKEVAAQIQAPALILLSGELGAGKTTFTKGLVSGFGAGTEDEVTSPTFTLIHSYRDGVRLFHIDLYRVTDLQDFETLGVEDLFDEPAVVIIEWPERMGLRAGWPTLRVNFDHVDESTRKIAIRSEEEAKSGEKFGSKRVVESGDSGSRAEE